MSEPRTVLLLGLDPHTIPGIDAAMIHTALEIGRQRFVDAGLAIDICLFKPDASAEPEIVARLTAKSYACIVIGGGLRKPDPTVELLERVIALIRTHAPSTPIAFNTDPTTSLDAALRCLPR